MFKTLCLVNISIVEFFHTNLVFDRGATAPLFSSADSVFCEQLSSMLLQHFLAGSICMVLLSQCVSETSADHDDAHPAKVVFETTDTTLENAFRWAQNMALGYARTGDNVGLWYEAALPGREAFCMRDVAHQSRGAMILGLEGHTINMLSKFAENISESKDWCSFWEINNDNLPAPVDYVSDDDFWYNLPANFDLIDACLDVYYWTGDRRLIDAPVFIEFYTKSLSAYIERWQIGATNVLTRDRMINVRHPDDPSRSKYHSRRGIPGYFEGGSQPLLLGADLIASQYAAFHAGKTLVPDSADVYHQKMLQLINFVQREIWIDSLGMFRTLLYKDATASAQSLKESARYQLYLLQFGMPLTLGQIAEIMAFYELHGKTLSIELASHLPALFYQYGEADHAHELVRYLADPTTTRREYPENPFAIADAVGTGLMGISANAAEGRITTSPRLGSVVSASIRGLRIAHRQVDIAHTHDGSVLRNVRQAGTNAQADLEWMACFEGAVNGIVDQSGNRLDVSIKADRAGRPLTCTEIIVPAGAERSVAVTR